MPRGDRTGPQRRGPKSGKGLGYCAGNSEPGCQHSRQEGNGQGKRKGRRRGKGHCNHSAESKPENESSEIGKTVESKQAEAVSERIQSER